MVVTRSQSGVEEGSRRIVFEQPPRSPSATTGGPSAIGLQTLESAREERDRRGGEDREPVGGIPPAPPTGVITAHSDGNDGAPSTNRAGALLAHPAGAPAAVELPAHPAQATGAPPTDLAGAPMPFADRTDLRPLAPHREHALDLSGRREQSTHPRPDQSSGTFAGAAFPSGLSSRNIATTDTLRIPISTAANKERPTARRGPQSIGSQRSNASALARIQYEAGLQLAQIKRQELQLERQLIEMKLAAEVAAFEEKSARGVDEQSEPWDERVNTWLQEKGPEPVPLRGEQPELIDLRPVLEPKRHAAEPHQDMETPKGIPKPLFRTGERRTRFWDTPREEQRQRSPTPVRNRQRSPTPPRSRSRGIEQLAEALEKMAVSRPPPRQATDLPIFSGAPMEWLQFQAAMKETTTLYKFTPLENLARLRNSLRGEAKEAVAALMSVSAHPDQIMRTLEQCFGRPEILVDRTLDELRRLPKLGTATNELNTFAVRVQNAVTVLRAVKESYLHNPLLLRDVLEKLSPYQKSRWYDFAEVELRARTEPEIIVLSEFLMQEADRALRFGFSAAPTLTKREVFRPAARPIEVKQKKPVFTATAEVNKQEHSPDTSAEYKIKCPACEQEHTLVKCEKFKAKSVQDRWEAAKAAGLCFKCITKRHRRINCRAKLCGVNGCKRPHHALLHEDEAPEASKAASATEPCESVHAASVTSDREVKLKICPVTLAGPKGEIQTYALFDEGSTVTLLDEELAHQIGADGPSKPLNMHGINMARQVADSRLVDVMIRGASGPEHRIKARTMAGLNLTAQSISSALLQLEHLKDLDPKGLVYSNGKPRLLLGADNWHLIVSRELRLGKRNQPAASRTQLGWVIHGTLPRKMMKQHEDVLHIVEIERHGDELHELVKRHYDIDALGVSNKPGINERDQRAIDIVEKTLRRRDDGYYEVGLPWKSDQPKLPCSYNVALRRLKNLEHKLDRSPEEKRLYEQQVHNLLEKGYAEKCDGSEKGSPVTWFLPHFAVKTSGKFRMVFDAAARAQGASLNDFLLEGPDLLRSLPAILYRFREEAVALSADIQEMFLRVKIRREDQPAQQFLWRDDQASQPTAYKMTSMIFGAASSPFIAHTVRNKNAEAFRTTCPMALEAITKAHYMDDFVDSYPTEEVAKEVIAQVDHVHKQANFLLRRWSCNRSEVLETIPEERRASTQAQPLIKEGHFEKTLGLLWNKQSDTLSFNTSIQRLKEEVRRCQRPPTKREALSAVMSIYDPLGLLSCYTITARVALQSLWRQKIEWDEQIPAEAAEAFTSWLKNLEHISHLQLPRCYNGGSPIKSRQLHVFCDASEEAYSAAVYWRLEQEDGNVKVTLAAAKAKVAPLRAQTIPRMELQAALIGARLGDHVAREHRWNADKITYWTDSQTVLHWIKNGSRRYTPFVAHRLGEIGELSSVHQWRWVPTNQNVADLATRAGYVPKSEEDPWFTGPSFLLLPESQWEQWETDPPLEEKDIEQVVFHVKSEDSTSLPDIRKFSKFESLVRATALILLFPEKCRDRTRRLDVVHLKKAEDLWIRQAQRDSFPTEITLLAEGKGVPRSSPLYRLDPMLQDGKLKLHGRIGAAGVPAELKSPVILDGRHPFARLLIAREHEEAGHANRERVVNNLRQKYWILRLRPTVRKITRECAVCRLRRANPKIPPMGDLPIERLGAFQRPFSNCGCDYFGPMTVTIGRRHEKRWGALFTCLTTRAVHIELAASLSTDSAIMALRRMAARRGWPAVMYTDNATNFKGAEAELRQAYTEWEPALRELGLQHRMQWKYIPPGAPNQGGAWERLVRSVKSALVTTLNEKAPKEEVLQTLLTEAEYSINSRPLTHVSVDRDDPEAITPNHFLMGSSMGMPYIGPCELADRRTWRAAQALADEFWRRWLHEYLPTLVPRRDATKPEPQLRAGDLVVVVDPSLPRNTWPRGVIERTYPGPDGHVRSADVKTKGGIFRRPTSKLAVLRVAEATK